MNTKTVGDVSEAAVAWALVKNGKHVLIPWGDNRRYDLAIDEDGKLVRIQVKTGRIRNGVIIFNAYSFNAYAGGVNYVGGADQFGVYCPDNNKVYLVPVAECPTTKVCLRLDKAKINRSDYRMAEQYELRT